MPLYVRSFNEHVTNFNAAENAATQMLDGYDSVDVTGSPTVLVVDSDGDDERKTEAPGKTIVYRADVTMSRHSLVLILLALVYFPPVS